MKDKSHIIPLCVAMSCAILAGCSKSSKNQTPTRQNGVLQSGRPATLKEIRDTSADEWLDRIGEKEAALGFEPNTALNALIEKGKQSDSDRSAIVNKAASVIQDSSQNPFKRWQSCYVISGIGDERGIPALVNALKDNNELLRSVAACALGTFDSSDAHSALQEAAKTEKSTDVQGWIQKALRGELMPKK